MKYLKGCADLIRQGYNRCLPVHLRKGLIQPNGSNVL
jgi:hypothetical protein